MYCLSFSATGTAVLLEHELREVDEIVGSVSSMIV